LKKYWYWILGTLALIGDSVSGLQVLGGLLDYFSFIRNPPIIFNVILSLFGVIGIIILIYYSEKGIQAPKIQRIIAYVSLLLSILLMPQFFSEKQTRKFVLVFDEVEPKLSFPTDTVITVHIDDVSKLNQVNQFENATIISTVSRPEIQWKKQFPKGNVFDSPIFSVQEVLSDISNNIVDISSLSYRNEIKYIVKEKQLGNGEIRIFYEIGYESIANNLKISLKSEFPNTIMNTINYDKSDSKNLLNKNITCIFLTSNKYFKQNIEIISAKNYKHMIVPNWLLCSIRPSEVSSNKHCVSNKLLYDLNNNDYGVWTNLITLIKSEEKNINSESYNEIVKNKILSSFAKENKFQTINF